METHHGPPWGKPGDDFFGPVVLVRGEIDSPVAKLEPIERYGEISAVMGDAFCVGWRGRTHLFCRETGKCVESPFGEMRGFVIAPEEMQRFAKLARKREAGTPNGIDGDQIATLVQPSGDPTHGARFTA